MSHMIATIDGTAAIAYIGDTPWHSLGTPITSADARDRRKVQAIAKADFTVATHPIFLADGREVPDRKAVLRDGDDVYLSTVGRDYQVRQYDDAFSILDDAIRDSGVWIETAGVLGHGERAWMLARMEADIDIAAKGGYDKVVGRFLVGSSHDTSQAHYAKLTPERVVCHNTLTAALNDGQEFLINIPHTKGQDTQLAEARKLVTRMAAALKTTGDTFGRLARADMTKDRIVAFIEEVFPTPVDQPEPSKQLLDKREQVVDLVYTSPGADLAGETAWGAYNAITYFVDHAKVDGAKSEAGKLAAARAAVFGTGDLLKARALALLRTKVLVAA